MKFSLTENRLLCLDFISIVCTFGDLCASTKELFLPDLLVVRHRMDNSKGCCVLISSWGFALPKQGLGLWLQCHCLKGCASLEVRAELFPIAVIIATCTQQNSLFSPLSEVSRYPYFYFFFFAFLHRHRYSHSIRLWLQLFGKGCSLVVKMNLAIYFQSKFLPSKLCHLSTR